MKTPAVQDEIQVSRVVLMTGSPSVIVTVCYGTRDAQGAFVWSDKQDIQLWPAGMAPQEPQTDIVLPQSLLNESRRFLIALEDYLQQLVDEPSITIPNTFNEIIARRYEAIDPRGDVSWKTLDGHNSKEGAQVPRPIERRTYVQSLQLAK